MSITTDPHEIVNRRVAVLTEISNGLGLKHMPVLNETQQQLFDLESSDPMELTRRLEFMKGLLTESAKLEAAYYVLGLVFDSADDSRRRGAVFVLRRDPGDLLSDMKLRREAEQGFETIASSYNSYMNLRRFILEKSMAPFDVHELSAALDMKEVEAPSLSS